MKSEEIRGLHVTAKEFAEAVKGVFNTDTPMEGAQYLLDNPNNGSRTLIAALLQRSFVDFTKEILRGKL